MKHHLSRARSGGIIVAALTLLLALSACGAPPQNPPTSTPAPATPASNQSSGENNLATQKKSYSQAPAMTIDPKKSYTAVIKTEKGDVRISLFADKAPKTVNNFVFLARDGFYDNTTFHRVMHDFMAQGGDPTGTGRGGPGYQFADEFDPTLKFDVPGILAMANSGPNTNGSQFFLTYVATPWLNGKHTIFGKVESGMDVVKQISERDPSAGAATPGDKILSITVEEK
jgi:cyclophilin family peptidyl-prolyl cis-trans isomerase